MLTFTSSLHVMLTLLPIKKCTRSLSSYVSAVLALRLARSEVSVSPAQRLNLRLNGVVYMNLLLCVALLLNRSIFFLFDVAIRPGYVCAVDADSINSQRRS